MGGESALFEDVLQLVSRLLEEADDGRSPQQLLCLGVAKSLDAPAAAYVRLERDTQICTLTCWPHSVDVLRLKTAIRRMPVALSFLFARIVRERRPSCVSADADAKTWPGSAADVALREILGCRDVAQIPLQVSATQLRMLALARDETFSQGEMDFLRVAQRPLVAIDRILNAADEPELPSRLTLTQRELEVLQLLADGLLAQTIATRLSVSTRTVHKHLGSVYRKLDAHDRLLAVRRARAIGLLSS